MLAFIFHYLGNFRRRVILIVFGKYFTGINLTSFGHYAIDYRSLTLSKQIRQNSVEINFHIRSTVSDQR